MTRFHHGHSAGLGFLLALALYGHALVFALVMLVAGVVIGRTWSAWARWSTIAAAYAKRRLA